MTATSNARLRAAEDRLREVMLSFPDVTEEFPWGHRTAKVRGKMFAILVLDDRGLHVTTKLPESHEAALMFPFAEPTGYGLGKSGWVSARFAPGQEVPVELMAQWMRESFHAVAPKSVLNAVKDAPARSPQVKKSTPAKKAPAAKTAPAAKKAPAKKAPAAKKTPVKKAPAKKGVPGVKRARTPRRARA
ncbi:MmcQ/YjbR family DNA-binding protein [Myxococcus landrumensis]|uniref:MmcQ/YjbR family DNA-binding protein n=1 Tax=Myxococcus landrumensis TaxID=2813577 RepID=A0ABX7N8M2_9BACT|nr:MmcQ/YjbR family DNA-binding protein [Myxococcus landrumus]QSQ12713.1 MmcQ/YjbR family DNA-binding protein [Myxococcus landrumus]